MSIPVASAPTLLDRVVTRKPGPNWFSEWFNTPEYHLLYVERHDDEALNFAKALATYLRAHHCLTDGDMVADLACGAGRHARAFHKLGYTVTGLDLAPESIATAQALVKDSNKATLSFKVHDMRLPFAHEQYQLVTNLFTSFGYFDHQEHNRATLSAMVEALVVGGCAVIDYLNPATVLPNLPFAGTLTKGNTTFFIKKWADAEFIYKNIGFENQSGWQQYDEQVQLLTPDWFRQHMFSVGLAPLAIFGDYELGPYTNASPRQIIIARKLGR